MIFKAPLYAFQSEFNKMLTHADEMDFSVYDSGMSISEILADLQHRANVHYGVIADISAVPTAAKVDAIVWMITVRIELFSNYNGRKQINDMIQTVANVATAYKDVFTSNLEGKGFSLQRLEPGEIVIGSALADGATIWQNGYITLNYYLSQMEE